MVATSAAPRATMPAKAVARRSISAKRSSRPSPRSPRIVSLRPPSRNTAPSAVISASPPNPAARSSPIAKATR